MSSQIKGPDSTGGNIAEVDYNGSLYVYSSIPSWPPSGGTSGGYYSVSFSPSAVTAASLAISSSIMSMRLSTSSQRQAYVTRVRVVISPGTLGTNALVPGTLGIQRFRSATPTGGVARTPNGQSTISGNTSNMTDIRDNNGALTVTNVNFGVVVATSIVPIFIAGGPMWYEWIFEPAAPLVLIPGDGIALRTQVAMPATQTWNYSYSVQWYEK
jgi:hypothetical protein